MHWKRNLVFLVVLFALGAVIAAPLYEINSERDAIPFKSAFRGPVNRSAIDEVDQLFPVSRSGETSQYYLGTGAANDTFAIVLEPVAACSVYSVQFQWFDAGNFIGFIANYNSTAQDSFPSGAVNVRRAATSVSPVGSIIRTFTPNTISSSQTNSWVTMDFGGVPFVLGNTSTGAAAKMVIGFVKSGATPHPLASDQSSRGYAYTWFGWGPTGTSPGRWGGYSTSLWLEVMCKAWVSYAWGAPIIILNPVQMPNAYSTTGPWDFSVELYDDGAGITAADQINVKWKIGETGTVHTTPLTQRSTNTYGAMITSTTAVPVGTEVFYWVDCVDDGGRASNTSESMQSFTVVAPTYPAANLLVVTDNLTTSYDGDRFAIVADVLDQIAPNLDYEVWDISTNNGIDRSVINHGWNNILYFGWGDNGKIPATTYAADNPWATYINNGHNLMVADQDYFFGAGVPGEATYTFAATDFAAAKFGVATCMSDPTAVADSVFDGISSDPITGQFSSSSFETAPEGLFKYTNASGASRHNYNDYITVGSATAIFEGTNDGFVYGCRRAVGAAKLALFPMMLEAAATEDTAADSVWFDTGDQLPALMGALFSWFGVLSAPEPVSLNPSAFALNANYPNPFNSVTTIQFSLPKMAKTTLKIYDMTGREVASLTNNSLFAGSYKVTWGCQGIGVWRLCRETAERQSDGKPQIDVAEVVLA